MKVVHILNEIRHSGAEIMLASAAPVLTAEEPMTIISTGTEIGDYAETLGRAGYRVIHIGYRRSPLFWYGIYNALRDDLADVLHIHTERVSPYYSALAAILGIGSVRTIHNEFQFTGLLCLRRRIWRFFARAFGTIQVSVSSRVVENENMRFGNGTILVDNWYDPSRFQRTTPEMRNAARLRLGLSDDKFAVVAIANEGPAKNLPSLLKAVGLVCNELPLRLFHCGAHSAKLEALAAGLPEGTVSLLGTVENIQLYLAACDAFICVSLYEGGQISLLEAAATGIACVTTRVGCAEDFSGLKNVFFIDSSPDSIADGLRKVAQISIETRSADGDELAEALRRRFTPEIGARRYLGIYRRAFMDSRRFRRNKRV